MRKKILAVAIIAAVAGVAIYNISMNQNAGSVSDLTLENLDAIAQGRGNFPACQKKEGTGNKMKVIPFCVGPSRIDTNAVPGTLDVNYCSESLVSR